MISTCLAFCWASPVEVPVPVVKRLSDSWEELSNSSNRFCAL